MSAFVLWGIVAHAEYPIQIIGGTNTECRRQATIRDRLPSYRCLRIVPEGQPYGEARVRHRESGATGTAVSVQFGNRSLPGWHAGRLDWVSVRWDDGGITRCRPAHIEYLEEEVVHA